MKPKHPRDPNQFAKDGSKEAASVGGLQGKGKMSDEDESVDPGVTAAEREIIKFLGARDLNEANFNYEGAREDRGTSAVSQLGQHPVPGIPVKQKKTHDELAMVHQDLTQIEGCPKLGIKVTAYGLNPWNSMLTFGVDAGPVHNKADLQRFCEIITDRFKRLYDVEY